MTASRYVQIREKTDPRRAGADRIGSRVKRSEQGTRAPGASARIPVLLGTQLLFNVGFYAVVPFLALVLAGDFGLAGAAVGLVLGVRTFAQQGMFLFGGVLADRFGARPIILLGCLVRTAGFLTLAASLWTEAPALWLFVVGTVLTGLGGALFSPGLSILVAAAEMDRVRSGAGRRATLFAWLSVTGEIGAVVGPLLGSLLLGWGFATVAASGAAVFALMALTLWRVLPSQPGRQTATPTANGATSRSWAALHDRRFIAFAALHAVDLLAYNQLYLTLPLELRRADDAPQLVGIMFAWVSILTLALQLPIARWCGTVGASVALRAGYCLSAGSFVVLAVTALLGLPGGVRVAVVLVATSMLALGHMTTHPTALSLVPRFAGEHPTGAYFGLVATCGGVAVLIGNLIAGGLFGMRDTGMAQGSLAWWFLALPMAVAAVFLPRIVREDSKATGLNRAPVGRRRDAL